MNIVVVCKCGQQLEVVDTDPGDNLVEVAPHRCLPVIDDDDGSIFDAVEKIAGLTQRRRLNIVPNQEESDIDRLIDCIHEAKNDIVNAINHC
jgi:hypothetical protein